MTALHLKAAPARGPSTLQIACVALAGGALLWWATALLSGRREAWDAPLYWSVTYPASIGLAAVLGYLLPVHAWRWGLAVLLAQAGVLLVTASSFGLLPLGLIVFGVLSLPAVFAAQAAAILRRARRGRR